METIIALDIGKVRTGIAKSDPLGAVIKPLKTIPTENILNEIKNLLEDYSIPRIIVGSPVNIEGASQETAKMIEAEVEKLKAQLADSEFIYINESYSSKEAEHILKNKGIKIDKSNKSLIDSYAAAILLEAYFNQVETPN